MVFLLLAAALAFPQTETKPSTAARTAGSATADLFRQLGNLPLDPNAVYTVRDGSIDREDIHISLSDGTIAFTRAVNGRITGAIFSGEGEVLIVPPDFTERQSLFTFTKIAVLSERFSLAYFRFVDDRLIAQLNPALRALEPAEVEEFLQRNSATALSLSEADALRTLIGLTYEPAAQPGDYAGEFFYARMNGEKLGGFDIVYDPLAEEQISARQLTFSPRGRFYDLWMSFPMHSVRKQQKTSAGGPVSQLVTITDYHIVMEAKPPTDLAGAATLTLRAQQSGARTLLFELSRYLKLSSVELLPSGRPAMSLDYIQNEAIEGSQLARRGNDLVAVVFPAPLRQGQVYQLKFTYAGSVMSEAGGGLLYVGARGTWYPNRGAAMSNFDLEFRTPAEWKLLATGRLVSSETTDGFTHSRFTSERPVPLAGFNLGKYVSTPAEMASTRIDVYSTRGVEADFTARLRRPSASVALPQVQRPALPEPPVPPPDPSANAGKVGDHAARMIAFLSPRIGAFPYSSLSITQLPGPNSQGWPGLIFLSSYVFLNKTEREPSRYGNVEAYDLAFDHMMTEHEVAHQWWGDNVFWDSYRDQWLMEALSNYSALLRLERDDPELMRRLLDQYRDDLLETPPGTDRPYVEAGAVRLGVRLNSSRFADAFLPVVYGRGSWLIHMLHELLRDPAKPVSRSRARAARAAAPVDHDALFFSVLKDLQTRFAGKKLTTAEFLQAFEKVLPASASFEKRKNLDWFFDGWINGSAIPTLKLDGVRITPAARGAFASGVILQTDAPELLVTPVPIYAATEGGATVFVGRIFADGERTEFRLPVPAGAKRLLLDPYFAVLRRP